MLMVDSSNWRLADGFDTCRVNAMLAITGIIEDCDSIHAVALRWIAIRLSFQLEVFFALVSFGFSNALKLILEKAS